ncbi:MAG: carbon-nitrogen hydrolase family protein [Candidatus Merdivicinus sp.]|jgi:predicted amidohydrolase
MKVGYIQYDVQRNLEQNLTRIEQGLAELRADLVVLPELCTCGYLFENVEKLRKVAEPVPDGKATEAFLQLSRQYQCAVIAGVPEQEENAVYNTAIVLENGKYLGKYRKIHLSDFEKNFFEAGTENPVFTVHGKKIGVQICFDLWFPEISREQLLQGAELFCALGNFGSEPTCLIARTRAMENLRPLVLCNRIGREQNFLMTADFLGRSALIQADGRYQMEAKEGIAESSWGEVNFPSPTGNVICRNFEAEIAFHCEK